MGLILIDTVKALQHFLENLPSINSERPSLWIDLEGNNLSRHGTISLVTIYVEPQLQVYLIDINTLGIEAFTNTTPSGQSLKLILESESIKKGFFDVRNDADALFWLFQVRLNGVEDVQLLELLTRDPFGYPYRRRWRGLVTCITREVPSDPETKARAKAVKEKGQLLFAPEQGGEYAIFDKRPLNADIVEYCAQDVVFLPQLSDVYCEKLCDASWRKCQRATTERLEESISVDSPGRGPHRINVPQNLKKWRPKQHEMTSREFLQKRTRSSSTSAFPSTEVSLDSKIKPTDDLVAKMQSLEVVENKDIDESMHKHAVNSETKR